MLLTGIANIIILKYVFMTKAVGAPNKEGEFKEHRFQHPIIGAIGMFTGEFLCMIGYLSWKYIQRAYYRSSHSSWNNQNSQNTTEQSDQNSHVQEREGLLNDGENSQHTGYTGSVTNEQQTNTIHVKHRRQ